MSWITDFARKSGLNKPGKLLTQTVANPVRGLGRIARGNFKEGLGDIGSSVTAMGNVGSIVPGVGALTGTAGRLMQGQNLREAAGNAWDVQKAGGKLGLAVGGAVAGGAALAPSLMGAAGAAGGAASSLGGSLASSVGGAAGAAGGGGGGFWGTVGNIGKGLWNNRDTILGVAAGAQGMADRNRAMGMQDQALQQLQREYDQRAGIRKQEISMLTGPQPQRESLASTFGNVRVGPEIAAGPMPEGIAAMDDSSWGRLQGRAEDEYDLARLGPKMQIAGTDLGMARGLAGTALGELDEARLAQFGMIDPNDYSGVNDLLDRSSRNVEEARIGNYGPVAPTDTRGVSRMLGRAGRELNNLSFEDFDEISPGVYGPSTEQARARQLGANALESVAGGPDRRQIAMETLNLFDEQSAPRMAAERKAVGRAAAAFGGMGQGRVTTSLGDLEERQRTSRDQLQRTLANDVAAQELADRQSRLNTILGAQGQYTGEDIATSDVLQGLRNEGRDERGFFADRDTQRVGLGLDRINTQRGLAGDQLNLADIARRDALTERDYATSSDATRADLALARAGNQQGLAGSLAGIMGQARGEMLGERDFFANESRAAADLALARSGARSGLAGQEAGFAGMERADRESDRAYDFGYDSRAADLALSRGSAFQGLGESAFDRAQSLRNEGRGERGDMFGFGSSLRDESRGERAYGDSRSDFATDRAIQQRAMEEDLLNSATDRRNTLINMLGNAGGTSPANLQAALGSERLGDAYDTMDTAGQLLARPRTQLNSTVGRTSMAPYSMPAPTMGTTRLPDGRVIPTRMTGRLLPRRI